jgi:hypothetical protein
MREYRVATTANRSVVGIMNEFSRLAEVHRDRDPCPDLTDLAQRFGHHSLQPAIRQERQPRPRTGRIPAHRHVHPQVLPPPTLNGDEVIHSAQADQAT